MDPDLLLEHCRRELTAFAALLDGDLDVAVEHCGDWDLYRLADHLGRQNLWAAAGITEGRGDAAFPRAPRVGLASWFAGTSENLLAALSRDPESPAWTIYPPGTVGFWRRRRAHETLVHRWDAEHALGLASSFDDALAADGIDEVLDTMIPRQISLGRIEAPTATIAFETAGSSACWGDGEPAATIRGTPREVLLLLWKRLPLDGVQVTGDASAVSEFLALDLVP